MKKILVLTLIAAFVLTATLGLAANKSAFFTRKVPGGPVLVSNETLTTGDIWFVDSGSSGAGTTSAYGQSPDSPCSTLEACVNNSTGSQGDWIVVMSGHAETLTSATELVLDKADIRIMGLGEGRAMPAFTVDNTAASINVDAANVTLENLFFDFTATDSVDDPFDINAADFSMVDCEIVFADSTGQADKLFTLDANADRFLLLRTTIRGGANAGATDAITAAGTTPEGLYIIDSSIETGECLTYDQAKEYVANLRTGGYKDWRLPDTSELAIVYNSKPYFPSSGAEWYWTSETIDEAMINGGKAVVFYPDKKNVFKKIYLKFSSCGFVHAVRP